MNVMGTRKAMPICIVAAAAVAAVSLFPLLRPPEVHLVGVVDADQIVLSAQVQGRIEKLVVEEGQEVRAGDLVAVIDGSELSAAANTSAAQAESAASQLDAAKASADSTVGEVAQGLASARASHEMALAALAEVSANRKNQEEITRRTLALAQIGAVTVQERDTSLRALEALEARERSSARAVDQALAAVKAAQARASQGKAARETVKSMSGQLSAARAQVSGAETRLGFTRIYAPANGRIATIVARRGEFVSAGSPVATLVDLRHTWVYAALPETRAEWIQVQDHLKVKMPSGLLVDGRVIAKAAEAGFATQRDVDGQKRDIQTLRFKVLIENPGGCYVPGMTAEMTLRKPQRGAK